MPSPCPPSAPSHKRLALPLTCVARPLVATGLAYGYAAAAGEQSVVPAGVSDDRRLGQRSVVPAGQGLTLVPNSAQLELFCPRYNPI
jgi:hypothetical protein